MNFIIRHLETLGDEVAAALDELADEVVGHRQTSRDRRSRTPELSDGESSSVAEPHAASSVGVPTTDDDSATDNDTSPAPLPMSSPPPNRPPMSSPGGSSSAATAAAISRVPCVKRRPLVATRIQPPVNSDPRLNEGQRPSASLQPAPIPTAVQQQYQQSSQQQQPDSPPCSPAKWMPDRAAGTTRSPVPERSTSPCLDDIGAPYVERPSQVHLMASATPAVPPPTTTQTRAQQSPEQQKTQPPSSKRKTVEEAKTTPPSSSVGRTASSEPTPQPKLAPAPPVVQSRGPSVAPAKPPTVKPASSDFDLCDRLDSPNVPAPILEGEYLVL